MKHPNILELYHAFEDDEKIYMVLELAEKGSLFKYLRKKKKLSEPEAFYYFFQINIAINFLHKNNILHRDIKVFSFRQVLRICLARKYFDY